ncbi:PROD dehydrogenase, partial [Psilopogon haemacephalus]|nr:PROD dehydrogenase [Psilopogon haemacephalus]
VRFSEVLVKWRRFFHQLAVEQGQAGQPVLSIKLELEQLQEALANLGIASKEELQQWFTGEKLGTSGTVDLLEWNRLMDSRAKLSKLLVVPNLQTRQLEPLLWRFGEEEELQMQRVLQRLEVLAKTPRACSSGLLSAIPLPAWSCAWDWSHTGTGLCWSLPTLSDSMIPLPCAAPQEAYDTLTVDAELSRRERWHLATKLVRGAYMEQERERAARIGYEDPINPTYEKTNEMYHRSGGQPLPAAPSSLFHPPPWHRAGAALTTQVIEPQNQAGLEGSTRIRQMLELGIHPSEKKVCFGQLLGMCDQITFPLGE